MTTVIPGLFYPNRSNSSCAFAPHPYSPFDIFCYSCSILHLAICLWLCIFFFLFEQLFFAFSLSSARQLIDSAATSLAFPLLSLPKAPLSPSLFIAIRIAKKILAKQEIARYRPTESSFGEEKRGAGVIREEKGRGNGSRKNGQRRGEGD